MPIRRSGSRYLWLSLLALLLAGSTGAQTPDLQTPANEGICDELMYATPGLYGLCVAYCEAQDCDLTTASLSMQCQPPNKRILENYDRKKQSGDPEMPCVQQAACPCWTVDELETTAPVDPELCEDSGSLVSILQLEPLRFATTLDDGTSGDPYRCLWMDNSAEPPVRRPLSISFDEFTACSDQIRTHGANVGFICF
jgi:hypothetical protein